MRHVPVTSNIALSESSYCEPPCWADFPTTKRLSRQSAIRHTSGILISVDDQLRVRIGDCCSVVPKLNTASTAAYWASRLVLQSERICFFRSLPVIMTSSQNLEAGQVLPTARLSGPLGSCADLARPNSSHYSTTIATLEEFVNMAARDSEDFVSSTQKRDKAITQLEEKVRECHSNLDSAQSREQQLRSEVRQGREDMRHIAWKLSLLVEDHHNIKANIKTGVQLASEAKEEREIISQGMAASANLCQEKDEEIKASNKRIRCLNSQIQNTRRELDSTKIKLAAQKDENRRLNAMQTRLDRQFKECQEECSYLTGKLADANESTANQLTAAECKINTLQQQLCDAAQECARAEDELSTAKKMAEQYLQELQDSEAVLSTVQKEARSAEERHRAELESAQQKYEEKCTDFQKQMGACVTSLEEAKSVHNGVVSKLETRIVQLESQLRLAVEEETRKLDKLVQETAEQFDKITTKNEQEIGLYAEKVSRLEADISSKAAAFQRLKTENDTLTSCCETDLREKDKAISAFIQLKKQTSKDIADVTHKSLEVEEQKLALQIQCAALEKELLLAKEAIGNHKRDYSLLVGKLNALEAMQQQVTAPLAGSSGVPVLERRDCSARIHPIERLRSTSPSKRRNQQVENGLIAPSRAMPQLGLPGSKSNINSAAGHPTTTTEHAAVNGSKSKNTDNLRQPNMMQRLRPRQPKIKSGQKTPVVTVRSVSLQNKRRKTDDNPNHSKATLQHAQVADARPELSAKAVRQNENNKPMKSFPEDSLAVSIFGDFGHDQMIGF